MFTLGFSHSRILALSHSRILVSRSSLGVHLHDLPILVFKPVLLRIARDVLLDLVLRVRLVAVVVEGWKPTSWILFDAQLPTGVKLQRLGQAVGVQTDDREDFVDAVIVRLARFPALFHLDVTSRALPGRLVPLRCLPARAVEHVLRAITIRERWL